VIEWASGPYCLLTVMGKFTKALHSIIKPWGLYVTSSDCCSCFQPKNPALQGTDGALNVNICVWFITLKTPTWWAVLLQSDASHVIMLYCIMVEVSFYEEISCIWSVGITEVWSGLLRQNKFNLSYCLEREYLFMGTGNYCFMLISNNCLVLICQILFVKVVEKSHSLRERNLVTLHFFHVLLMVILE
jgi:hypothetical protein